MVLPAVFGFYRPEIEAELRAIVGTNLSPLNNLLHYHLGWIDELGQTRQHTLGKLVRATLCLVSCQAVGGNYHRALPAAAALELVHNFSLIHDDVEDGSVVRHHQPTVWKLWGEAQAINAGDALYALAHLALMRLRERGVAADKVIHSLKVLDEACIELCQGQYLDVAYEGRFDVGVEEYLDVIAKKTAALMAASTCLGALLGTKDENSANSFHALGKELGLAYQIRDDILGIWGLEKTTGKLVGDDIIKKKKTLPVIYGLQQAGGKEKQRLLALYRKPVIETDDIPQIVEILDKVGAKNYSQILCEDHYHQALKHMEKTNLPSYELKQLKEIAHFFVEREY